ncbi:MAG: alpha/beta hydrolase [Saprospiraceae bacterium]|nr:alpha/beta hydrolase [Saprospiraceae bacterium]
MINRALLFLLLFVVLDTSAQEVYELWPGVVPGQKSPKADDEVKPDRGDGVTRLTNITNPAITVYEGVTDKQKRIGLIVCPGGGYQHLAIDKEGTEIAAWLNELGYTAFVLTYRVPDNLEGAIQDLRQSITWVRHHKDRYSIDADKIGTIGFSAGANLSVWCQSSLNMGTVEERSAATQNFQLLIYPAGYDEGPRNSLTPGLIINKFTTPTFIFATADDKYANSALVLAKALRDAKIPVELHLLPEGGHGYGLRAGNTAATTWPDLAARWLTTFAE